MMSATLRGPSRHNEMKLGSLTGYDRFPSRTFIYYFAFFFIGPVLLSAVAQYPFSSYRWVSESVHSSLEAIWGIVTLIIAPLLLIKRNYVRKTEHFIWMASALLCSGSLDLYHSLLPIGAGSAWSRVLSTLFGGILMALVWLPHSLALKHWSDYVPRWTLAATSVLILFLSLFSSQLIGPFHSNGTLISSAILLNALGGLGYFSAATYFIYSYLKDRSRRNLMFGNFALLLGVCGFFFGASPLWSASWWLFHVLRLFTAVFVLNYLIQTFRQALVRAVSANIDLEQEVKERTSDLERTNFWLRKEIEERQHTEEALTNSESNLRQLADSMPHIVWVTDASGKIQFFNQRWVDYTGLVIHNVPFGEALEKVLHPSDLRPALRKWQHSLSQGSVLQIEFRVRRRRDEQYHWHLARAVPVHGPDGRILKWIGTCTDIHEQKQILDHIRIAGERLRLATSAARIGTWELELNSRNFKMSPITSRMFSFPTATESTPLDAVMERIHAEDREIVKKLLEDASRTHRDFVCEFRVQFHGQVRWMYSRGRPFLDRSTQSPRMIGVMMDITDRRQMEEQLKEAVKHANEANALKSAFLANMSHEIRTPLGAILGFTDLLHDPSLPAEDREHSFEIIQRNGEQLSHLINDILDLSKIEAGQVIVETLRTNFRDILQDVMTSLQSKADVKNIRLQASVHPDVPEWIGTDPIRLQQVLSNIIGNAIKFTLSGSVTVTAHQDASGKISIQVLDTGIGLTREQADKLFRPFTQADESTTRKFGGTGLGLALSKKLAQALGGDLILKSSSPGSGSLFEITIENRALESPAEKSEGPELNGLRVLLIEDSPENQKWLSKILKEHQARVDISDSGKTAVEKALQENFDVILVDLHAPDMNGIVATEKLRQYGFQKPIILVTSSLKESDLQKCQEVGCTEQVQFPIRAQELLGLIARCTQVA